MPLHMVGLFSFPRRIPDYPICYMGYSYIREGGRRERGGRRKRGRRGDEGSRKKERKRWRGEDGEGEANPNIKLRVISSDIDPFPILKDREGEDHPFMSRSAMVSHIGKTLSKIDNLKIRNLE